MSSVILAYVPVLHEGYYRLFTENGETKKLYVLADEVAKEFTPVHKEIRALTNELIISAIESWNIFESVELATVETFVQLNAQQELVIIPDELVTKEVAKKYLPNCEITSSSIFLRWDKVSATQETFPVAEHTVTDEESAQHFMQQALGEGEKSSDWWRHVGAIAVRDGKVLGQAHNTHLPTDQQPYIEGDPRAHFHKGDHIELTTGIHAEAKLIAEAAAAGIALTGADLFVTDFPCPVCAKSIVYAGFKKVYFVKGYAMLDGETLLRSNNIEIIQVTSNF
jgi:dCMP deaminase